MAARQLLLALLLLGSALTGCLGGDDGPEDLGPAGGDADGNITDVPPDGRDGKIIAFEETNATEEGSGGLDHPHDMWNGQSRVVIFEQDAAMEPYPDDRNQAYAEFRPTPGALIYEATESIDFTISNPQRRACPYGGTLDGEYVCSDYATGTRPDDPSGGPTGLKLRYKHAATTTWTDAGELTWGTPYSIKITDPRQTDMPHATSSLWEFMVVSPNAQDVTLTFTVKAELVRGDADIPMWPGHPDFYSERASREVLNAFVEACDGGGCTGIDPQKVGPVHAQKLISYGTRSLHVWVNITEYTANNPALAPNNWFLYHRNATGRDNVTDQFSADAPIEKREFYWIFPVDDDGMDSPYADGSRWNFQLGASLTTPVIACYENCAEWHAKYSIVVHATNQVLPDDQYTMYCLRDSDCPPAA